MISQQLLGREQVTLDAKYRLALPARYRATVAELCSNQFVLTEHPDGFLVLMPQPKWQVFSAQFANTPISNQWLKRTVLGSAVPCELDSASRVLIPQELRESASIDKLAYLVGVGEYFEVWNRDVYNARAAKQKAAYERERERLQSDAEAMHEAQKGILW